MKFKVLDTENNEFVEKFVIDQDGNVMVGDDYCGACDQPKYSTVEQPLLLIEANADTDACTRTCPDLRELRQENERLRAALEMAQSELRWGDYENAIERVERIIDEALSTATEPTAERVRNDGFLGEKINEKCPKCGADLLGNKVGDKWCSMAGCDYGINAPEGDGNDA